MPHSIAILDFGSQYAQLIARRVRESHVYCELFPWDTPQEKIMAINPQAFILSGGPNSVYAAGAPVIQPFILESGMPILGICYGMQLLTHALGGQVDPSAEREYGKAIVQPLEGNELFSSEDFQVWMSHGDRITRLPEGFVPWAKSGSSPFAAMADPLRRYFGLQFHPEVNHTIGGSEIIR
ncbi:MAG: glutamine-hydrolyzing GMP synthase, partial [Chloroflexota bacterium]